MAAVPSLSSGWALALHFAVYSLGGDSDRVVSHLVHNINWMVHVRDGCALRVVNGDKGRILRTIEARK